MAPGPLAPARVHPACRREPETSRLPKMKTTGGPARLAAYRTAPRRTGSRGSNDCHERRDHRSKMTARHRDVLLARETTTSGAGRGLALGGPMALRSGTEAPRDPAAAVLYQVVRDHCLTFRAEASQPGEGEGGTPRGLGAVAQRSRAVDSQPIRRWFESSPPCRTRRARSRSKSHGLD